MKRIVKLFTKKSSKGKGKGEECDATTEDTSITSATDHSAHIHTPSVLSVSSLASSLPAGSIDNSSGDSINPSVAALPQDVQNWQDHHVQIWLSDEFKGAEDLAK